MPSIVDKHVGAHTPVERQTDFIIHTCANVNGHTKTCITTSLHANNRKNTFSTAQCTDQYRCSHRWRLQRDFIITVLQCISVSSWPQISSTCQTFSCTQPDVCNLLNWVGCLGMWETLLIVSHCTAPAYVWRARVDIRIPHRRQPKPRLDECLWSWSLASPALIKLYVLVWRQRILCTKLIVVALVNPVEWIILGYTSSPIIWLILLQFICNKCSMFVSLWAPGLRRSHVTATALLRGLTETFVSFHYSVIELWREKGSNFDH